MKKTLAFKARAEFVRHVFDNNQALIKHVEQKTGFSLIIAGLLCAALFPQLGSYLAILKVASPCEKAVVSLLAFWFLFHIVRAISNTLHSLQARANSLGNYIKAPEQVFPLMILRKYGHDQEKYLLDIQSKTEEELMADYVQQIIEISHIYEKKHNHLNEVIRHLHSSTIPWAILVVDFVLLSLVDTSAQITVCSYCVFSNRCELMFCSTLGLWVLSRLVARRISFVR